MSRFLKKFCNKVRYCVAILRVIQKGICATRSYFADKGRNTSERVKDELIQSFDLLSRHTEAGAIASGSTRLNPMRYFPYVSGYILFEGMVHVSGIQHCGLGWGLMHPKEIAASIGIMIQIASRKISSQTDRCFCPDETSPPAWHCSIPICSGCSRSGGFRHTGTGLTLDGIV